MESANVIAELDAVRLSDWIDASGLSRSTAYELLKLLGIEPEARRVPTSRKPVSHLSAEQIQQLQPWASELARGATLPQIRERLGRSGNVSDASSQSLSTLPADQFAATLATLISQQQALPPAAPTDPLRTAKALAEAAELGVALSTAELAGVLGMAVGTVRGLPDGHSPRPGFILHREKTGNSVWWLVERPGRSGMVPDAMRTIGEHHPGRTVGFAQVFDVQAIALPNWLPN
jgi:hypothetical protein